MGRQAGGGFMFGNACTPVVDSRQCMAKPIQYGKVKLKKKKKERKNKDKKRIKKKQMEEIKPCINT